MSNYAYPAGLGTSRGSLVVGLIYLCERNIEYIIVRHFSPSYDEKPKHMRILRINRIGSPYMTNQHSRKRILDADPMNWYGIPYWSNGAWLSSCRFLFVIEHIDADFVSSQAERIDFMYAEEIFAGVGLLRNPINWSKKQVFTSDKDAVYPSVVVKQYVPPICPGDWSHVTYCFSAFRSIGHIGGVVC